MRHIYTDVDTFQKDNLRFHSALPLSKCVNVLMQPLQVEGKRISNRLVCQPMEGCDGTLDGSPDILTTRRYERLAGGGAGLIWFEATAVMKEGRANPRQLFICDNNLDDFKRQVDTIKTVGLQINNIEPVVIMQATHSGRYSKPFGVPAPLIVYHNPIFEKNTPIDDERIVTDDYLDRVTDALIHGAELAEKAGFDGVDIKCCHRYLNSELLSAFERTGRYGGSLENRTRLLRESIRGAKSRCGREFLVTTRLNVYDGFPYPYGFGVSQNGDIAFDPTESIWLLQQLRDSGVHLVNITMGNPYFNPHVNRPYAQGNYTPPEHPLEGVARMLNGTAQLKKFVPELKYICSAMSYLGVAAPQVAAAFIAQGGFDLAGFGRTALAYPDFAHDILDSGEMKKEKICICCSKCTQIMRQSGGTPGCVVRDREVYLPIYKEKCGAK